MDNRPKSAIKPSIREELLQNECKPRQMSDGNVKVTLVPNNKSTLTTTSTTMTSYSENRSSSMSSVSSGGVLLAVDPHMGVPGPKSPSLLKRSSSWKKFKNTVKETVSGIVNLSVGQTSSNEAIDEEINTAKIPQHLCENLTPDVEQKLVHCSTEDVFQPSMEEGPSAFEKLEKQAEAAFAAAANLPAQSTPIMVTLPPTVQSHAPQLSNLTNKGSPSGITAVPQIVVTADTPVIRRDLKTAAMSSPRKILKNIDKTGEEDKKLLFSSPPNFPSCSSTPPNSPTDDKSIPISFSNSMTNLPNLSQKRVSWGDVPSVDLPDPNKTEPVTDKKVPSPSSSSAMTDEEKKRAARIKIKNALLGAAASAGNDNLKSLMQVHLASPGIPIQQSSSTSNMVKTGVKTGSLIPESDGNLGRVRRSSECGLPGDDVLEQSAKGGSNVSKIGRSSSMRKAKPKPMIWEHFDVVPNNSSQGRCKACHMTVSCKHNTGQFVRHLQLAHMDIFRKYEHKIQTEWTKSIVQRTTKQ